MDPNATPNSMPNFFPPPPSGLNYIAAIQPSLTFLMVGTVWSSILLPLLVALFFFSTKNSRRQPIFILNVLSMVLGLFMGVFNAALEIHAILSPLQPFSPLTALVFSVVVIFTPWLVELVLVVRLVAVYPFSQTPKRIWYSIFVPLAMIKLGRLVNILIYLIQYITLLQGPGSGNPITEAQKSWDAHPGDKIEWILQVVDNTATSILFISRLKSGLGTAGRAMPSSSSQASYITRLKGLFWIAVSNFVFPVILSIVQLVMLFRDPNFLKGSTIFLTNDYVEIVGVLLATVWASTSHWTNQKSATHIIKSDGFASAPRFAKNFRSETRSLGGSDTFNFSARVDTTKTVSQTELGILESQHEMEFGHLESRPEFADAGKAHSLSG